ncbi:hypothetical protein T484DRAFT_1756376, partial [Baffinella frigidus]
MARSGAITVRYTMCASALLATALASLLGEVAGAGGAPLVGGILGGSGRSALPGPAEGWRGGSARSVVLERAAGTMALRGGAGMAGEGVDLAGLRAGIMEAAEARNEVVQIDAE